MCTCAPGGRQKQIKTKVGRKKKPYICCSFEYKKEAEDGELRSDRDSGVN